MLYTPRMRLRLCTTLAIFLIFQSIYAAPRPNSTLTLPARVRPSLFHELPVLDLPFNTALGFSFPSLQQSSALTNGVTRGVHQLLADLWQPQISDRSIPGLFGNRRLGGLCLSILIFDALSPFSGWTHEEGHRAVLSRRGISSRNDIYQIPAAEMVSISHVRDEDLAWLKDRYPADMVRLAEAGGEIQLESIFQMRRANFFEGRTSKYDLFSWWLNLGEIAYYLWLCGDDAANQIIEEETLKEDPDISKRDIIGGDYLSWVYDLYRPDEPYLAGRRGRMHPSGVGVDRYLQPSELTHTERRYLQRQGRLFFLNFLAPQMFGLDRFRGTNPITHRPCWWNVALTHHLTAFGTTTGLHLYLQEGNTNLIFTFDSHLARDHYWPGFSIDLLRYPITIRHKILALSAAASAWMQPKDQRFDASQSQSGYGIKLNAAYPFTRHLGWFIEGDAKSQGWIAGNVYLDAAAQVRTGLTFTQ
ncbi:hypothetical protein L0128_09725 [candidate division KSB1 bacterium]|nr:hypothetical protein [candidate division KSB1 bacterium]